MLSHTAGPRHLSRAAEIPPAIALIEVGQQEEQNRLLRALPAEEYALVARHLSNVKLEVGDVMAEQGAAFEHVLFVDVGMVSIVNQVGGSTIEVGTVGNEGVSGLSVFLDDGIATSRTFVQVPGSGKQIDAAKFSEIAEERPAVRRLLNRYAHVFLATVAQTAACNLTHQLNERCARWLLMTHDRMNGADTFPLTHQFLSAMLGVRRSGVTVAAGILQQAGLIRYSRGNITVTNREGLEAASCECYGVVRAQFEKLLS